MLLLISRLADFTTNTEHYAHKHTFQADIMAQRTVRQLNHGMSQIHSQRNLVYLMVAADRMRNLHE